MGGLRSVAVARPGPSGCQHRVLCGRWPARQLGRRHRHPRQFRLPVPAHARSALALSGAGVQYRLSCLFQISRVSRDRSRFRCVQPAHHHPARNFLLYLPAYGFSNRSIARPRQAVLFAAALCAVQVVLRPARGGTDHALAAVRPADQSSVRRHAAAPPVARDCAWSLPRRIDQEGRLRRRARAFCRNDLSQRAGQRRRRRGSASSCSARKCISIFPATPTSRWGSAICSGCGLP